MLRLIIVTVLAVGILLIIFSKMNNWMQHSPITQENDVIIQGIDWIPANSKGEVIQHKYFALSYLEEYEQAEWVAYHLTKTSLLKPNVKRSREFRPDYKIKSRSAIHSDYTRSGYTRGHLAPAGDMAFNQEAMEESFIMSNMSPQLRAFNNGIWKELEENVRNWAFYYDDLYVITGPIFKQRKPKVIGKNEVAVPDAFFKAILDAKSPAPKMIAFLIPHAVSEMPLTDYIITVDSLEAITGLELFDTLLDDAIEARLEAVVNPENWHVDPEKYNQRVRYWNNN